MGLFLHVGWENIADRHCIGTNGGYWVYQIPSEPGRGILSLPNKHSSWFLIYTYVLFNFFFFLQTECPEKFTRIPKRSLEV